MKIKVTLIATCVFCITVTYSAFANKSHNKPNKSTFKEEYFVDNKDYKNVSNAITYILSHPNHGSIMHIECVKLTKDEKLKRCYKNNVLPSTNNPPDGFSPFSESFVIDHVIYDEQNAINYALIKPKHGKIEHAECVILREDKRFERCFKNNVLP